MATPFDTIYPLFLSQITDYDLANMDEVILEENMQLWLLSSIGFFSMCQHDLADYDLTLKQFNCDLNYIEKQILSLYMLISYLQTQIVDEKLLKQNLNSKDYRMYSPANQLKALNEVQEKVTNRTNTLLSRYSYNLQRLKEFFK